MKTGNIVLPLYDNGGGSLEAVHSRLRVVLVEHFGGFTSMTCEGAWRNAAGAIQTEPGVFYLFSGDYLPHAFKADVVALGAAAKQEAIYWAWDGVAQVTAIPARVRV